MSGHPPTCGCWYCLSLKKKDSELDRLRAENAELREKTALLLDHYVACYDGNMDQLAIDTRAILAKTAKAEQS